MKDFSKDILNVIEQKQIFPRPRWVFFVRQCALLGGFVLSVLIGGLSVSVILLSLTDVDWDAPRMISRHPGPFLITYLPYIWIVFLVVFGIAAYYEMRNTKSGYRYRAISILGASFLASLAVGGILHSFGMSQIVDRRFSAVIPQYRGLDARKTDLWMHPGDGMLAGNVVSDLATTTFILDDFTGARWIIDANGAIRHGTIETDRVRVIGSVVRPGLFRATDIFPWARHGMMQDGGFSPEFPNVPRQGGMMFRSERIKAPTPY